MLRSVTDWPDQGVSLLNGKWACYEIRKLVCLDLLNIRQLVGVVALCLLATSICRPSAPLVKVFIPQLME